MESARVTQADGGGPAAPSTRTQAQSPCARLFDPPGATAVGGPKGRCCWQPSPGGRLVAATLTAMFLAVAGLALFAGCLVLVRGGQGGRAVAAIPLAWAAAVLSGLVRRVRRHVVSVSMDADGTLSFRTWLQTVVVPAGSLQAIRPARADAWGLADWRVVTRGHLLTLPRAVQRHPELVAAARQWNPHAEFADE